MLTEVLAPSRSYSGVMTAVFAAYYLQSSWGRPSRPGKHLKLKLTLKSTPEGGVKRSVYPIYKDMFFHLCLLVSSQANNAGFFHASTKGGDV